MGKNFKKVGLFFLTIFLVLTSSCLFTRIDELILEKREFKEDVPRTYFAPLRYISAGDIDYAYIEKGEGPTIILLHGGVVTYGLLDKSILVNPAWDTFSLVLGANLLIPARAQSLIHFGAISTINTWEYNFEELSKHFRVIALDLPGFGASSKPDIRYTIPEMTELLNQFIEAKGLDKVVLVGQDFSGLVAIDYSLTYPEKVSGLVLVSPYGTISCPYLVEHLWHYPRWISRNAYRDKAARVDIWRMALSRAGKNTYKKLFYRPESKLYEPSEYKTGRLIYNPSENARKFVEGIISYKFDTDWIESRDFVKELYATHLALQDVKRKDYRAMITLKEEKDRTDWITRVKLIQTPTLIIWGKFDPVIPVSEGAYLDQAIANSLLSIYEQSAHYPMIEESEIFNQEVTQFIEGIVPQKVVKAKKPKVKKFELEDIYFDFDSYELTEQAKQTLVQNARLLKEHPEIKVILEGYCDERGSEEYNLVLGEKRAKVVRNYLINLGVDPTQISIISYGESMPIDLRHCEEAWRKNRRVHFITVKKVSLP